MNWPALIKSSLILFAIVNPIGSVPIFLQLTHGMAKDDRKKAFQTAVLASFIILFVFVFAGQGILTHFFQIQIFDLMAAGGLLLLIVAIDHLIFGALVRSVLRQGDQSAHQIGAVPMACPILAGPGAMMTAFLIYSEYGFLIAAISIVVVMVATWLIFCFIDVIYKVLGQIVCIVLSKILCLFIAAIGIHLLMQGLSYYLK